jgi:hypothetical protein
LLHRADAPARLAPFFNNFNKKRLPHGGAAPNFFQKKQREMGGERVNNSENTATFS